MEIKLDKRFKKHVEGIFGKYEFEVGVLDDKPHKEPLSTLKATGKRGKKGERQLSSYAGGPIRKTSRQESGISIAEVSEANRERIGFNYLTEPFKKTSSGYREVFE